MEIKIKPFVILKIVPISLKFSIKFLNSIINIFQLHVIEKTFEKESHSNRKRSFKKPSLPKVKGRSEDR